MKEKQSQKEEKTAHQDITMEKEILDVISERRQSPTLPIPKWDLENLGRKRKFNSACGKTGGFDPASNGTIPKGDESESLQRKWYR